MRATAYDFAQMVDAQIESLPKEELFLRTGRSKRLQEELLPLSRLGLHFTFPGLSVEVEAFEDNRSADGHIKMSGYKAQEFDVEVTYLWSYQDSMRGELLQSKGVAPGAGPINRDKKTGQVIAEYSTVDHDEHIKTTAEKLLELHSKKLEKPYPQRPVLLIAFDEITIYGHSDWLKMFSAIAANGSIQLGPFRAVYLLNCGTNELQSAA